MSDLDLAEQDLLDAEAELVAALEILQRNVTRVLSLKKYRDSLKTEAATNSTPATPEPQTL